MAPVSFAPPPFAPLNTAARIPRVYSAGNTPMTKRTGVSEAKFEGKHIQVREDSGQYAKSQQTA